MNCEGLPGALIAFDGQRFEWGDTYAIGRSPGLWGIPPAEFITEEDTSGDRVRHRRHGVRRFRLKTQIKGTNNRDLQDKLDEFATRLDPVRGDARLVIDDRELTCVIDNGLGPVQIDNHRLRKHTLDLMVVANWPYWRSTAPTKWDIKIGVPDGTRTGGEPYGLAQEYGPSGVPYGGIVYPSAGRQQMRLVNPGTVEAWPVWRMKGPLTRIEATSLTHRNARWVWNGTLPAGVEMVISTDPRSPIPVRIGGLPDMSGLGDFRGFWPLLPDVNHLLLEVAADPTAELSIDWYNQWTTLRR